DDKSNGDQDHQREKQISHKGSHQDASQINIPCCAHWISLKQVFQPIEEPRSLLATGVPFPPTTETLQVIPATSDTSGGTCSILIRTGIRCASRTQVKIGSTFGRPCVLLAAFATLM